MKPFKRIGISQRVEVVESYAERRDCLDQAWGPLLWNNGCVPVPLCNQLGKVYLDTLHLDGLVVTGGNDLMHLSGATNPAEERDQFEKTAIEYCLEKGLPILAVCRGMQLIADLFGCALQRVENHIATTHTIVVASNSYGLPSSMNVNSFHRWGIEANQLKDHKLLDILATSEDGLVEAVVHKEHSLLGIMWHPERGGPNPGDGNLIGNFFNSPQQAPDPAMQRVHNEE